MIPRVVDEFEIEYEDIHHFKNLYVLMYTWLIDHGFESENEGMGDKFETLYFEKVHQNEAKEHHIWWRTKKRLKSDFFDYKIRIDFQTINLKSTKVMKEGDKVNTNVGDSIIRGKSTLIMDKHDYFKKNKLLKLIEHRYINFWGKTRIDEHYDELQNLSFKLKDTIKQYLELHTSGSEKEPFYFPPKGI